MPMFLVRPQFNKEKQTDRVRSVALSGLLCFLLVFVQGAGLAHTHEGDLQKQFDCEICLKANSNEDVIASNNQSLALEIRTTPLSEYAERIHSAAAISANSRAPPLV